MPSDSTSTARPIGVFDSGLGGLTVVRALRALLPSEHIVYLGDTARVPYGTRSAAVVRRYARGATQFLLTRQAKALVVACNTASAHALSELQATIDVPVIGVIEASAMAAATSLSEGTVGVVATQGTVLSQAYQHALSRLAPRLRVVAQACPMLVPLAEEGLVSHPATRLLLEDYLRPVLRAKPSALILGCTHYPVFLPLWQELSGQDVRIIDSASSVAELVARSLAEARLARLATSPGRLHLVGTDITPGFRRTAELFLGAAAPEPEPIDL